MISTMLSGTIRRDIAPIINNTRFSIIHIEEIKCPSYS